MKIFDPDGYEKWKKNNTDEYGEAIFKYAERWADLMEDELTRGKELHEICESTSKKADTDGLTGFMFNASLKILQHHWDRGRLLRKLYNRDGFFIRTEEGEENV